jgi:hypothetical protein
MVKPRLSIEKVMKLSTKELELPKSIFKGSFASKEQTATALNASVIALAIRPNILVKLLGTNQATRLKTRGKRISAKPIVLKCNMQQIRSGQRPSKINNYSKTQIAICG